MAESSEVLTYSLEPRDRLRRAEAHLRLLQLADSLVPIGAQAHSFGLEALVTDGWVDAGNLGEFVADSVREAGRVDAAICRAAYRLAGEPADRLAELWTDLNQQVGAMRTAREVRSASASLGRRFLLLALSLEADERLERAQAACKARGCEVHYATAFGLVGGVFGLGEDETTLALLQQTATALLSAAQRLLPVGQGAAASILWRLKPVIEESAFAQPDEMGDDNEEPVDPRFTWMPATFSPALELASMRHAVQRVRLFIS